MRRLPEVQVVLHNHLQELFPTEYARRRREEEEEEGREEVRRMVGVLRRKAREQAAAAAAGGGREGGRAGGIYRLLGVVEGIVRRLRVEVMAIEEEMEEQRRLEEEEEGGREGGVVGGVVVVGPPAPPPAPPAVAAAAAPEADAAAAAAPPPPPGLGAVGGAGIGRRLPPLPPFLRTHRVFLTRYLPWLLFLFSLSSLPPSTPKATPLFSLPLLLNSSLATHFFLILPFGYAPLTYSSSSLASSSSFPPSLPLRSYIWSRHVWPKERLELAVWSPDSYHRMAGMVRREEGREGGREGG